MATGLHVDTPPYQLRTDGVAPFVLVSSCVVIHLEQSIEIDVSKFRAAIFHIPLPQLARLDR